MLKTHGTSGGHFFLFALRRKSKDWDKTVFLEDERTIDAVARNLEIVGKAVRQLPDSYSVSKTKPETRFASVTFIPSQT